MINMDWTQLALKRVEAIEKRVQDSLKKSGRKDNEAKILAVSKTFPAEALQAFYQAGLTDFAESYINEARPKINKLNSLLLKSANNIKWHFIGHLQSNKAKYVARQFDTLHSLDSLSLAAELNRRREDLLNPLEVFMQINLTGESQKAGIGADELENLLDYLDKKCPNLKAMGLMTMPIYDPNPETSRPVFAALRKLRDKFCPDLKELSMGMSGDFEVAIEEGATLVRVGTALFGNRD